jgi:two-component system, chemotaxis family, protein-glutamate methylesterase/glutaminase
MDLPLSMRKNGVDRAIAIGGSTGAIAALKQVLGDLPADLPAPVLVVVHVGARGRDLLAESLNQHCSLSVATAMDEEKVEPGCVYVAPADHHLLVIDGIIRLGRGPRENMARPALDALFRSVAISYGSRAVGLVLSGHLHDGAAGLAAVKQCGGLTAVQNPSEASAPDMPLEALEASDIDYRAPSSQLGALLAALVAQLPGPAVHISRSIELEVDIALGRPCLTTTIAEIAEVAPLSCPACGGVLSEIKQPPLRFRCQVGHGYSAKALMEEQEGSVDEAIRLALRIIEERATLTERMARDATSSRRPNASCSLQERADELRSSADVLRRAALRMTS